MPSRERDSNPRPTVYKTVALTKLSYPGLWVAAWTVNPSNRVDAATRVPPAGFEPATRRLRVGCSEPLSYEGLFCSAAFFFAWYRAASATRRVSRRTFIQGSHSHPLTPYLPPP